jgi:hypothetical protein
MNGGTGGCADSWAWAAVHATRLFDAEGAGDAGRSGACAGMLNG